MSFASLFRREGGASGHGLGLGWLLAFSLGGAVLLFTCVGLLLSWRIKSRPEDDMTTMVYEIHHDRAGDSSRLGFTRRLTRRKYVMARSTSRLSLSLPSLLPPLPTYQSFPFFGQGGRKRSQSWVEEDKFHGPKIHKSLRNSWLFKRESWLGKAPTLPNLVFDDEPHLPADEEKAAPEPIVTVESHENIGLHVQKRQEETSPIQIQPPPPPQQLLQMSQTAPQFSLQTSQEDIEVSDSAPRIPAQVLVRPSITDSDLNDILRSTERRLRTGKSRSPSKVSLNGSPIRGSPSKTPRSQKTISSQGSIRSVGTVGTVGTVRITQISTSPSKRATICSVPQGTQHSRNASISSIGSAAQSLIAEAAQELVFPGGHSSPSKPRSRQWEPPEPEPEPEQIDLSAALHVRTLSLESDQSSTLSTVYSVGEQEERKAEANSPQKKARHVFDPFTDTRTKKGMPPKQPLFGPRLPKGQQRKLNHGGGIQKPGGIRPILRPTPGRAQTFSGQPMFSIVLDPPSDNNLLEVESAYPVDSDGIVLACPLSPPIGSPSLSEPSITSMVTPSVTTVRDSDSESDVTLGTPENAPAPNNKTTTKVSPSHRNSIITVSQASPMTTVASTPYDERDIISLLMSSSSQPKRVLPEPPRHFGHVNESTMPVPISPRPRRDFSQQLRKMSTASNDSSLYDEESAVDNPGAVSTGSPGRGSTLRSIKSSPAHSSIAVGNSVAELRRMNSMISSYSVASVASSTVVDPESPTLPTLRGGGFSPSRSNSRASHVGRRNYLSLGTSPKRESGTGRSLPSSARSSRANPRVEIREDDTDERRENRDSDVRIPHVDLPPPAGALREARRGSGNHGPEFSRPGKVGLNSVDEIFTEPPRQTPKRMIRDSLGMYDHKGFLKSSPNRPSRDVPTRAPRM